MIHRKDRHAAVAIGTFSLGTPVKQVFAGHVIYMVERTSHLLIEGHRLEGRVGGDSHAVC